MNISCPARCIALITNCLVVPTCLLEQLNKGHARCGVSLAWLTIVKMIKKCRVPVSNLHYVGVATNEGHREHPERDHGWEVEGSNTSTNTKGRPAVGKKDVHCGKKGLLLKCPGASHLWQVRSMSLLTPTRFSPINRLVTLHACSTTCHNRLPSNSQPFANGKR